MISSFVLPCLSCLSSLNSELQEEEENDLQLDEKYFQYSGHPNSCDTQELVGSSVFPSHEPKVSSTVDGNKLNLNTCIELQNPPKLEGDALKGLAVKTPGCELNVLTDTMSVLKQKIMKRKQLFCKWRMACRFPGLQALAFPMVNCRRKKRMTSCWGKLIFYPWIILIYLTHKNLSETLSSHQLSLKSVLLWMKPSMSSMMPQVSANKR
ncbi:hypothetical protein H1C71_031536 [Ictidomys tridecemlineatus]|nr:hypothetical protein H1C71_031536 [Ictidomys tridecemlineatus]